MSSVSLPPIEQTYIYYMRNNGPARWGGEGSDSDSIVMRLHKITKSIDVFVTAHLGMCGLPIASIQMQWDSKRKAWNCTADLGESNCTWQFRDVSSVREEVVARKYIRETLNFRYPLNYYGESGAIKQSLADIFAVAFRAWGYGDSFDWGIGNPRKKSYYNLSTPHTISDFKTIDPGTEDVTNDYGHVHDNARVLDYAFYTSVQAIQDVSYGTIAHIWLRALAYIKEDTTLVDFALATVGRAVHYSSNPKHNWSLAEAVIEGWEAIGVLDEGDDEAFLRQVRITICKQLISKFFTHLHIHG